MNRQPFVQILYRCAGAIIGPRGIAIGVGRSQVHLAKRGMELAATKKALAVRSRRINWGGYSLQESYVVLADNVASCSPDIVTEQLDRVQERGSRAHVAAPVEVYAHAGAKAPLQALTSDASKTNDVIVDRQGLHHDLKFAWRIVTHFAPPSPITLLPFYLFSSHQLHINRTNNSMDFSCHVQINNESSEDLLLEDSGLESGNWPLRQPLNVIEAGTQQTIYLAQPSWGGSKAWVTYEARYGQGWRNFTLEFECPAMPLSKNHVKVKDCSRVFEIDVTDVQERGSPLTANVTIRMDSKKSIITKNDDFRANYDIGVGVSFPTKMDIKFPVHESIVVAAFIESDMTFPRGTVYNNINDKQWEFFRGVVWNDDPSCLLFEDVTEDNRMFGLGVEWLNAFKFGDEKCMTKRSHMGDLQFFHGMGSVMGEKPQKTRKNILTWMEVMYKLACGDQGISEDGALDDVLPGFFTKDTIPSKSDTLRDLILATTPKYKDANIRKRAFGICLHMISDSYALGHTQRRLRNPSDLIERDTAGYIRFKPDTYGDWGSILCFHTYNDQDGDRHAHYDDKDGEQDPAPRDVTTFNEMIGARNAIMGCTEMINLFIKKTPWKEGVKKFLEDEIFVLDRDAKPSDHFTDESVVSYVYAQRDEEIQYRVGLERKLASLEEGGLTTQKKCDGRSRAVTALAMICLFISAIFFTFFTMRIHGFVY
ncbi:hypothetical protein FCIRC_1440 [Fusarium circinatum]|uniref:Uncharacterized protein n=1 Tax=Fusarium circinatum TaxID=48490 RepID=A0A8H5UHQ6_FUSCI|nr:hypothetical protein FCIRC_1440 [Fusarium circinatum]